MADLVFHFPRSWLGLGAMEMRPFYRRVITDLKAKPVSFDIRVLERETLPQTVASDDAVHVVHHGRYAHPRVRNADVAYIYPFWNFDPQGIRAFSSIGQTRFAQDDIDPDVARPFFRRLRKRVVLGRTSRYAQPDTVTSPGPLKLSVFLQSEGHRVVGETCYLDRWQMLETACESVDGPIVVKPHPRDKNTETVDVLRDLCARFPHLSVSEGNIHDLIAASDRVLTINSAVGIETYLHRKPVVLCGQSDFHHIADVARSKAQLAAVLQKAPRKRAYDKFIWWYFGKQCLSSTNPDLVDHVLERCGLS